MRTDTALQLENEKTIVLRFRPARQASRIFLYLAGIGIAFAILGGCLLRWGGYLLISDHALLRPVDAALVLQGSVNAEKARLAGAVRILQQGTAKRIGISIPGETYWGQRVAPLAYADLEKNYGPEMASDVDFCETKDVDSTEEEAAALIGCVNRHGWHSIVVITSDYHTRRAGIIWRRILREQHSSLAVQVHAVPDPDFHASGWWRDRRSAKTWILEITKLVWTLVGGP